MDTGAVTKTYTQYPTRAFSDFDVDRVRSALRALEVGNLGPAALMADAMMRDERIGGHLDDRIKGLMKLPREVVADAGDGRKRGGITKEALDRFNRNEFGSRAALRRWVRYGLMLGVSFGQNVFDTTSVAGRWIPRLESWHPGHFRYDFGRDVWTVQTREGVVDVDLTSGKWSVYALADDAAYMEGLIRRLAIPWLIRQFAYRDWARYSEVHGLPIRKGRVPAEASAEQRENFLSGLAQLGNETTIEIPELSNEMGRFDVELVEASSRSWEGFRELLNKCEASIAITILGQNLTSEVKGGSRAAATVHESVKADLIADDALTFGDAFSAGVLRPFAVFNYGDPALTPRLVIDAEPPEDLKTDAETFKTVTEAVANATNAGYDVDLSALEDKYGIKLVAKPEPEPAPAGDGLPATDPADPKAPKPKATKPPKAPKGDGKAPTAGIKAKAGAAGVRLASGGLADPSSGFVGGQMYADDLVEYATKAGAGIVKDQLATIGGIIDRAESYDDLRQGLKLAFADTEPDDFAPIMQKALILANMGGRLAVLQDL